MSNIRGDRGIGRATTRREAVDRQLRPWAEAMESRVLLSRPAATMDGATRRADNAAYLHRLELDLAEAALPPARNATLLRRSIAGCRVPRSSGR